MLRDRYVFNIAYGCMESPTAPLALTLVTLKGQSQGQPDFKALYLVVEPI